MVNALIDRGADVNAPSTNPEKKKATPLMAASVNGRVDVIRVLLAAGARVNLGDAIGWTALMSASYYGQIEAIRVLLAAGAQINQVDASGWTALIHASQAGRVQAVMALLAAGADPRITTHLMLGNRLTALDIAQVSKHSAVVSLLQAKLTELACSA